MRGRSKTKSYPVAIKGKAKDAVQTPATLGQEISLGEVPVNSDVLGCIFEFAQFREQGVGQFHCLDCLTIRTLRGK